MAKCVDWIVHELQETGFSVKVHPTGHRPVIYAEKKGSGDKTILFYNHYDVVPVNRADWESDPFEPCLREGRLYGRGTSDHKSSFLARLFAVKCLDKLGEHPVTVKFLLEGDEEANSPDLYGFVNAHRELLRANGCLYPGWRRNEKGMPRINCGSRGNFIVHLICRTADKDLHELNAALVPNALTRVMQAVASLFDADQNVMIKGFYDAVRRSPALEKAAAGIPFDAESFRAMTGCRRLAGGIGPDQAMLRSTLTPVVSCYAVESSSVARDVLPCEATAHLRFYIVPDQDAETLLQALRDHLRENGFSDCEVIADQDRIRPSYTDIEDPFVKAVEESARETYGVQPLVVPISSGTGPKYVFTELLGVPTVSDAGVGDSLSNDHAANESIVVENYYQNIEHIARIMRIMAKQ
ncbi:MAG: M20/M25/M40 family metallo-hydrolase [Lachnospiraceae bacterium]|nr:M20/M25/M40 family metallo-hydrolase [Lachnospiraceae bacterium]